jgi:hypothetical protein
VLSGNTLNSPGTPDVVWPVTYDVLIASTAGVDISAIAWDNDYSSARSGWGVNFKISDASGMCTDARLKSQDGSTTEAAQVFAYTGPGCIASGNAYATVKLLPKTCPPGSRINVDVWIPDDIEAMGGPMGRLDNDIPGAEPVRAMVAGGLEKSGAYYIGDCDGDGVPTQADLYCLNDVLNGPPYPNYSAVKPHTGETQDLDGSCSIGGSDQDIISLMLGDVWGVRVPSQVIPVAEHVVLDATSVNISAKAWDTSYGMGRAGWGINFKISTESGLCTSAQLKSQDGDTAAASQVFAYDWKGCMGGGNDPYATVKLLPGSCQEGDSIEIILWIPDDDEAGNLGKRLQYDVTAESPIRAVVR